MANSELVLVLNVLYSQTVSNAARVAVTAPAVVRTPSKTGRKGHHDLAPCSASEPKQRRIKPTDEARKVRAFVRFTCGPTADDRKGATSNRQRDRDRAYLARSKNLFEPVHSSRLSATSLRREEWPRKENHPVTRSNSRETSPRWSMNWLIRICTSDSAGPIPISASVRRKRNPWLTLFARPSGLKRHGRAGLPRLYGGDSKLLLESLEYSGDPLRAFLMRLKRDSTAAA